MGEGIGGAGDEPGSSSEDSFTSGVGGGEEAQEDTSEEETEAGEERIEVELDAWLCSSELSNLGVRISSAIHGCSRTCITEKRSKGLIDNNFVKRSTSSSEAST